ncbi:glycine zipper 2TM domain-containing protein [Methylomonas sp. MO1]|uniref:glycine zipper 2TM domain-containing protein n=1 Tax=unclassified Methylomonas TaxID=2608980 RepID=UPI00055B9D8C|nr:MULTISPECIES: glycine zipper 2TM domain-containing protein [unclassified Methylomonas]MDT4290716.1 glycine zipper 2TM domain-containing protein [Methylomonas sp. MO1]
MFRVASVVVISLLVSPLAMADGHGRGHHKHHHHDRYVEVERVYVPERVVQYVPAPTPAPRYNSNDQRSTQGLVGGALGSVAGYEMSKGDPLGAGIGAAAGAWIGNSMSR